MASYTPCEGSGQWAVNLVQYPSRPDGLGATRAKTFGDCPVCGRCVREYGLTPRVKVKRHKEQESEV